MDLDWGFLKIMEKNQTSEKQRYSEYLSNIERLYPAELASLPEDIHTALTHLIDQVAGLDNLSPVEQPLRQLKALFSYRWALARLDQSADFETLGQLQTGFAEATIQKALVAAWSEKAFTKIVPQSKRFENGDVPGLFVLGLGKLGGYDLNFSSDVDLIAFYNPDILPVPEMYGRMDVCVRVLKRMTHMLSKSIGGEFVWRVDWRLRPDASVNPIVMSSTAAQDFYFFRSLPWHRLAMIKARVVAGDQQIGQQFLHELEPYLWRQNLDYTAVDDIHRLKQKINQEHPQLKLARAAEAQGLSQTEGFNLKLGQGGIREIEFIVNAMQLLWGGKKPALRNYSTLSVLNALRETSLFKPELVETLSRNYKKLRRMEDALQIRENLQVHSLPRSDQALNELQHLLGDHGEASVEQIVKQCTAEVSAEFQKFFASLSPAGNAEHYAVIDLDSLPWYQALPKVEQGIVNNWSEGFSLYAVPPNSIEQLTPLFHKLVELICEEKTDSAELVNKLHHFFQSTPKGGQYLRLLGAQPGILKDVLEPLASSPAMTILLEQSPHIVDYMLEPAVDSAQEFDSDFVMVSTDFDVRLKRLRSFVNEQLYDIMLSFFKGKIGSIAIQQKLTRLAEHCLDLGLSVTADDLGVAESPIAVLGMGKLGMRAMAPLSDLDLIFIAKQGIELEEANRFSHRFRNLMEIKTSEGRAYEMDTRLRPSGRSGPVTVTVEGFERYHLKSARSWEHIALVPSRAVSGVSELQKQIEDVRAQVLSKKRSRTQFILDAAKMHKRIREQRIGREEENAINVKLRPGGMFETDYLCACLTILSQQPEQSFYKEYDQLIDQVLQGQGCPELKESIVFWRSLQIWSRILGLETGPLALIHPKRLDLLLADMQLESPEVLLEQLEWHSGLVSSALENVLAEAEDIIATEGLDDWDETPVEWGG